MCCSYVKQEHFTIREKKNLKTRNIEEQVGQICMRSALMTGDTADINIERYLSLKYVLGEGFINVMFGLTILFIS